MSSVAVRNHFSTLLDAVVAGDHQALIHAIHETIARAEDASELLGKMGLAAMRGDDEGHAVLTLGAASMLCRWLVSLRHVLGEDTQGQTLGVPLIVQSLTAAAPAIKAGKDVQIHEPQPIFPSELHEDERVAEKMREAIAARDASTTRRLLFGLFGTGADYRAMSITIYDSISQNFQEQGHTLLDAVRGAQVLDAAEWGENMPDYIHWLTPHLILHTEEPSWMDIVHGFLQEPQHSLASYRTRLMVPQNEHALPLRTLLLSDAPPPQICQAVYDALIKNGASARAVGSVISLAACDLLQYIGTEDHDLFTRVSHGLLYASATRLTYTQVQEVEALPLLFTAAVSINALYRELGAQATPPKALRTGSAGGGLIAPALLDNLAQHIKAQDVTGAMTIAHRYLQLGHDAHALFAIIGLEAAQADARADQGHTLQLVLAAGDEYLSWPKDLAHTPIEGFLQVALHAVTSAKRNTLAGV